MDRPVISFLSDFGPDGAAAVCRGVMLSIARDAQFVDISHAVQKYSIRDGAFLLCSSLPFLPVGVHVAIVDPGVGTERRPVAIRVARGDVLVGPDNGLLLPVARLLGGVDGARVITNRELLLPATSATFHGRDIFAPVGAHLAVGRPFADVGPALDPAELVDLRLPEAVPHEGVLESAIVYIDSFGNCRLAGGPADLAAAVGPLEQGMRLVVESPGTEDSPPLRETTAWQRTFGTARLGASLLYEDSSGHLAFADNQGNLARRIGAREDQTLTIRCG